MSATALSRFAASFSLLALAACGSKGEDAPPENSAPVATAPFAASTTPPPATSTPPVPSNPTPQPGADAGAPATNPPPVDPNQCRSFALGCTADIKEIASQLCSTMKMELVSLGNSGDCSPGAQTQVQCCMANQTPPPADPNNGQCAQGEVHATGCTGVDALSQYAQGICAQAGSTMASFTPAPGCSPGQALSGTFQCCGK